MNFRLSLILPAVLAFTTAYGKAPAPPPPTLDAVLAQMDTASASFKNARADFKQDYYERIVKDTTTESGSVYFERSPSGTQMGAVEFDPASKKKLKVYDYKGGVLRLYDPGQDQIRLIKPTSSQGQIETFLTLGFGGSGKDLAKAWSINLAGEETIDGVKCEKLELVSKDSGVRNSFSKVTIWVDPTRAVSLKQVFETPSHDIRTSTYSHIKVNGSIDRGTFEIKKTSTTTTVGP